MNREEYKKVFGNKVRIAREARGMTLEELGEKVGYSSRSSMSLIELGKRGITTVKAQLIAQALRVDVMWLIDDEDTPPVFIDQSPIESVFEKLTPENKHNLLQYAEFLIKQQEAKDE